MFSEKNKEYFITRYSLVPDSQIDLDTLSGVTKEQKFYNWINNFSERKRIDTMSRGKNYTLYCNKLSDELSQLKDADLQAIEGAYATAKRLDSEHSPANKCQ